MSSWWSIVLGAVVVHVISGCGGDGSTDSGSGGEGGAATAPEPDAVNISLASALIRPWDTQKEEWDGSSSASSEEIDALLSALANVNPYAAALEYVSNLAADGWAPPDPFGQIELFTGGQWRSDLQIDIPPTQDTFNPPLYNDGWPNIPVEQEMRVRVVLWDEDVVNDDPIGSVELNRDDMMNAYFAGGVYPVNTSDQDAGSILFVSVSITAD